MGAILRKIGVSSFHAAVYASLIAAEAIAGTAVAAGKYFGIDSEKPMPLNEQVKLASGMEPGMVEKKLLDRMLDTAHKGAAVGFDACASFVKDMHSEGKGHDKYLTKIKNDLSALGYNVKTIASLALEYEPVRKASAIVKNVLSGAKEMGAKMFGKVNVKKTAATLSLAGMLLAGAVGLSGRAEALTAVNMDHRVMNALNHEKTAAVLVQEAPMTDAEIAMAKEMESVAQDIAVHDAVMKMANLEQKVKQGQSVTFGEAAKAAMEYLLLSGDEKAAAAIPLLNADSSEQFMEAEKTFNAAFGDSFTKRQAVYALMEHENVVRLLEVVAETTNKQIYSEGFKRTAGENLKYIAVSVATPWVIAGGLIGLAYGLGYAGRKTKQGAEKVLDMFSKFKDDREKDAVLDKFSGR